ncbi:MAG: glycosyltransferase [Acidobacteria bacterium]|nr:glycosyltransferase [Acidobacteriota bacterium]
MKTRVLEVLATLKRAGAERTAVTLAAGLDRARFECEVVSLYDASPGGFEDELAAAAVRTSHLGKRPGFDPRMYPALRRAMRAFRPAVVHTHSYVMRYAWPVSAAPVVHTVHNLAGREVDRAGRLLHRIALRRGARFVAIGAEVARSFRELYRAEPAAIIPNGVDLAPPRVTREEWRRTNGFAAGDILIASVARLDPQKNPLDLVQAVPNDPRCRLLLAGAGALEEEVRRHAGGRVHLLGVRDDIADLLRACDVFALASGYEGLPVAVIEAMGAGLPVVATAVGGVPELVEHGRTGLLVPPCDPGALAEALASLAADPGRRAAMGARARERAREFSAARMIASYAALFEKIAEGRE